MEEYIKIKNDIVTIHCYGDTETKTRLDAIKFYRECAVMSEGCEKERYMNILLDLYSGKKECYD